MGVQVRPDGPLSAQVMIVGEAPGAEEEARGVPFVGASGAELNRMLSEAGISRSECFVTNVARERPLNNDINQFIAPSKKAITPAHKPLKDKWVTQQIRDGYDLLLAEIRAVKPRVVIALGNVPLWALTGHWGITKWRGSVLHSPYANGPSIIPTIHPASVLREWSQRSVVVHDLRRAVAIAKGTPPAIPSWSFTIKPRFEDVIHRLDQLQVRAFHPEPLRISFDLETRSGHIACAGLSWSLTEALCIPFMQTGKPDGYWGEAEEAEIVLRLYRLLTHPNVQVVGQNLLYDAQYTWRWWGFVPRVTQDTMIAQHSIFSDMPKGLAFLASLYCQYYVYWKDEGKDWRVSMNEEELWSYNCRDCVYTDEVGRALEKVAADLGMRSVYDAQQRMFWPVLRAMQIGVAIDRHRRGDLILEVTEEIARREQFIIDLLGHPLNPKSSPQMQALFYEDLKLPIQYTRAAKGVPARPTLNDEALSKLAKIEPLVKPLITAIQDIRTLGVFMSNFLTRSLDTDGRMRCAYNIGGSESGKSAPKTYRLSSSENAFGSGGNLQNIPSEKSKSVGKAKARGTIPALGDPYSFPNIRSMFVPDPGYTWFDGDLDRADLQVVVYESDDAYLKAALHLGADIHLLNAFVLEGKEPPPLEELVETHGRYHDHRGKYKFAREFAKVFCHATNYGGGPRTVAAHVGRTQHDVDRAQRIWFGAHPGIRRWHDRVEVQIRKHHFIENRFGYRWYIFDRVDSVLPEAIAWIPQSTVSIVINRIWLNFYEQLPEVQVLMQVHDSLCGQLPAERKAELLPRMLSAARIIVPYEDPLIIPFSLKTSEVSWGDVK